MSKDEKKRGENLIRWPHSIGTDRVNLPLHASYETTHSSSKGERERCRGAPCLFVKVRYQRWGTVYHTVAWSRSVKARLSTYQLYQRYQLSKQIVVLSLVCLLMFKLRWCSPKHFTNVKINNKIKIQSQESAQIPNKQNE